MLETSVERGGRLPVVVRSNSGRAKVGSTCKIRALENFMGRLLEYKRQHAAGNAPVGICNRLHDAWPAEILVSHDLDEVETRLQAIINTERQKRRQSALSACRQRMRQCGKAATRWLHDRSQVLPPSVSRVNAQGVKHVSSSVSESLEMIRAYWERIWHRSGTPRTCGSAEHGGTCSGRGTKHRFRPKSCLNRPSAIPKARQGLTSALRRRCRISRLAFGKTVLGVFGNGSMPSVVMPELALRNLDSLGCPRAFSAVLWWVWPHQLRWLQPGQVILPQPSLVTASVSQGPQGCPAAPLALCVLLATSAATAHENSCQMHQTIFVDDRAAVVYAVCDAVAYSRAWADESARLGLEENWDKFHVVSRSMSHLLAGAGLETADEAEVLGTVFSSNPQKDTVGVEALSEDHGLVDRLARLPLSPTLRESLYRSRVASRLTWGLWFRTWMIARERSLTRAPEGLKGNWHGTDGRQTCVANARRTLIRCSILLAFASCTSLAQN